MALQSGVTTECLGPNCKPPAWMRTVLVFAGFYNVLFGLWAVLWPELWFRWSGMDLPTYPMLWQCIGMIVGVYGIGYLAASRDPIRHWPIVLVGFLGKVLGPFGFAMGLAQGTIPWTAGWIIVLNDLVWWIPFALILWVTVQAHMGRPPSRAKPYSIEEAATRYKLSTGETLLEASADRTLALVFLRHFGCTFTRQLLRHLEEVKADVEKRGGRLVLVHMLDRGQSGKYIQRTDEVARISDPYCELYRAFGLGKGGFWELLGPRVWVKGFFAFFSGCGAGPLAGDGLQMPGAFLFRDGKVISSQPARTAADLPDVQGLFRVVEA